jgi:hypothetical protein
MNKDLPSLSVCAAFTFACTSPAQTSHAPSSPPTVAVTDLGGEPTTAKASESQARKARAKKPDRASITAGSPSSGERFPDTPVGRALHKHLLILVDISAGADERKERSLEELRKNPKEASQTLLAAYHAADPKDFFRRWLLTLTLSELGSNEAYLGLHEIAHSKVPADLKDNDLEGSQLANESAIRQNSVSGLILLARAGNSAAEKDLLGLALDPTSGDDAVRTAAIKGYLVAGRDYEARVQTLKARLPSRYHDVVTLTVSEPDEASEPRPAVRPRNGG